MQRPSRLLPALLAALAACAPDVAVRRDFDFQKVRRVAVVAFKPVAGYPESAGVAADPFAHELLKAGYDVVERQQVEQVIKENKLQVSGAVDPKTTRELGKLLGVDALLLGDVTDFIPAKTTSVVVPIEEDVTEPIMGRRPKQVQQDGQWVTVQEEYIKGYRTKRNVRRVPQKQVLDATVGASVRLVWVETGQVLWSGSASEDSLSAADAAGEAAHRIVRAVKKTWPRVSKD